MTSDFMNKINNNTVTVSTSDELKEALEQNNGYEYLMEHTYHLILTVLLKLTIAILLS
jgi:hypothetical protein